MLYNDHYWGMKLLWWLFLGILLFWVFATRYDIHGLQRHKASPLSILLKRFALGEITTEEYTEKRKIFEKENILTEKNEI